MTDYTITGVCPTCHKLGKFKYIGEQEDGEGGFLSLYECQNYRCGTSVTGREVKAETMMVVGVTT